MWKCALLSSENEQKLCVLVVFRSLIFILDNHKLSLNIDFWLAYSDVFKANDAFQCLS